MTNYQIDNIDKRILRDLQKDSRKSYEEIARELDVSGGTIHVRIKKLRDLGIIEGSKININYRKLGYNICAFIGINLKNFDDYQSALKKLKDIPEILEIHYTTGQYSMFTKVIAKDTNDLYNLLARKLQDIKEIQSTQTITSLDIPVNRDVSL